MGEHSRRSGTRGGRGAGRRRLVLGTALVVTVLAVAAGTAAAADRPAGTGDAALVPGTPCTVTARACVDVDARRAWLLADGAVVRGPVRVQTGDRESPTPRGTFRVEWKAEQYTSREFLVQMPYSVFFAPGGVAFHQGRQDTPSAGCVKLLVADARAFFAHLRVDDEVQVT